MIDDVTRGCPAAILDTPISGRRVARELTALIERRGKPGMIVSDNGTELTSTAILRWCFENRVEWRFHHAWKTNAEWLREELQRADAR